MARTSVGLDIGTRAVRLAEVGMVSGRPSLARFGRILLPVGAVEHGELHDPMAVGGAIATLWKRLGLTGRSVHIGVSNRRVVVRVIELPAMTPDDLAGAIRFQAQEHIPIPLDEAVMDYEVLNEIETPEGERFQRVLVVAAERATIEPLIEAVRYANLEPATLELNAYPLVRCFATASGEAEAIVDIGAGVTDIVVHQNGKIRFTRILPTFGGDEFTVAVVQGLGVDRDQAEMLKRRASALLADRARNPMSVSAGNPSTFAPGEGDGTEGYGSQPGIDPNEQYRGPIHPGSGAPDNVMVTQAASIIEPLLERFITEVRGSIDFYSTQQEAPPIARVVLTGGGSLMGGVGEQLAGSLAMPVEFGRPFDRVPVGRVEVSMEERSVAEPFLALAIGLGLVGAEG